MNYTKIVIKYYFVDKQSKWLPMAGNSCLKSRSVHFGRNYSLQCLLMPLRVSSIHATDGLEIWHFRAFSRGENLLFFFKHLFVLVVYTIRLILGVKTCDTHQWRKKKEYKKVNITDPNPNNSYKTKKNFTGFYTEVNNIMYSVRCCIHNSNTARASLR